MAKLIDVKDIFKYQYSVHYQKKSLFLLPILSLQIWHGIWDGSPYEHWC